MADFLPEKIWRTFYNEVLPDFLAYGFAHSVNKYFIVSQYNKLAKLLRFLILGFGRKWVRIEEGGGGGGVEGGLFQCL